MSGKRKQAVRGPNVKIPHTLRSLFGIGQSEALSASKDSSWTFAVLSFATQMARLRLSEQPLRILVALWSVPASWSCGKTCASGFGRTTLLSSSSTASMPP